MKIKRIVGGNLESNTYVIYQKGGANCFVIDPGYNAEAIAGIIIEEGLFTLGIILTHCHADHTGAAKKLKDRFGCKVYIHREDMDRVCDIADVSLEDGHVFDLDGEEIRVIHTPGHTHGGICLYSERSKLAFTGDTLFNVDLGRTDLEGGDEERLTNTCVQIIDKWPNDITVYPGHGDSCNMKFVRRNNEEFKAAIKPDIKMIALDLDGTTLTTNKEITDRTADALSSAMKKGIQIVIATGRTYSSIPDKVLNIRGMEYIITGNGAAVTRLKDGKIIYSNFIDAYAMENMTQIFKRERSMLELFTGGRAYIERSLLESLEQKNFRKTHIEYIRETRIAKENIIEFMIENKSRIENINLLFENQEDRARMRGVMEAVNDVTVTTSFDHNIEIGGKTTSKGDAVRFLSGRLGMKRENVMVFGDGHNDMKMFEFAGFPVAVENAKPELKEVAKFVTASNIEDGVAKAIERFVL
ncbi:MAG: Cof-type HAD-IIB family hydrolase [Eubacteriales bacterium]|nr:Cof-type HAD-IIB family hydrolase [Eubacteriales bacterium]